MSQNFLYTRYICFYLEKVLNGIWYFFLFIIEYCSDIRYVFVIDDPENLVKRIIETGGEQIRNIFTNESYKTVYYLDPF